MADRGICTYVGDDEDCQKPAWAKGYCNKHYGRQRKHGDPSVVLVKQSTKGKCDVNDCPKRAVNREWCNAHYQRWYKLGDPEALFLHEQQRIDAQTRTEKKCPKCGEIKPLDAYGTDRTRPDGLAPWCKLCKNKATHDAYVATHPDWSLPMTPEEQLENSRRIKREYKQRHPEVTQRWSTKRRLLIEENYVEDVDPIVLADSEDWICWLCEDAIDPTLHYINPDTGKINEGYRSVDHIQAISRGGEHSYVNVHIAHWICNVRRWTGERDVA